MSTFAEKKSAKEDIWDHSWSGPKCPLMHRKKLLQFSKFRKNERVLNVLFFRRVYFLQRWTFRTGSAVVLNVLFCRRVYFLQKRTSMTTANLVLKVNFCRKKSLLFAKILKKIIRHKCPFTEEFVFCESEHLGPHQLWF